MKAKGDTKRSWEKQQYWNLENGWVAVVEWNQHYGKFIKKLESPEGKIWLASNGRKENGLGAEYYNKAFQTDKYIDLPEFARAWQDDALHKLVRPNFEIVK